jgi:hypothetical protein
MQQYRLTSPIVAIEGAGKGIQIRQIASGEILDVPDVDKLSGLTDIVCRGRSVSVFIEDLRKRADPLEVATMASLPSQAAKCAGVNQ